ncbi:AI-2E family transporter [Dyadobacter tibetensis]|uniref:AI-2E family transporter n=1 Tax=Dyadobacter tibetensis TaxID=1211851 RepID=UPI0004708139|nr:AI-2E family transporter [Dyadobacter tibetensis]
MSEHYANEPERNTLGDNPVVSIYRSLVILTIVVAAISFGQDIIVPLALAFLLAVLLRPIEAFFIRLGLPKALAISLTVLLAVLLLAGVILLLSIQISEFSEQWPKLKRNINDAYRQVRRWVRREYSVSFWEQDQYIKKAQTRTIENLQNSEAIGNITGSLGTLVLLPIYVFLLLYYRTMFIHFSVVLFADKHKAKVLEIMGQIKTIIQSYMLGLLLETAAVATMNAIGLLILNVQYAILLAAMAAILNLVPYIGGLVATALAVAVTFMNHPEGYTVLGVVLVFIVVQLIDNNLLVPLIVGSKVRINALVSILGVLVGGAIAGLSGMFLSIPTIAIMKAIFDRVDHLKAWGILLGDETPEEASTQFEKSMKESSAPLKNKT